MAKSMKLCVTMKALAIDGMQGDLISCFKEGKKCAAGKVLWKTQILKC